MLKVMAYIYHEFMKLKIKKNGFSILEVVVAVALMAVMGVAILAISFQASASANSAKLSAQATKYAEEGLELARMVKNQNSWGEFYSRLTLSDTNRQRCYENLVPVDLENIGGITDDVAVNVNCPNPVIIDGSQMTRAVGLRRMPSSFSTVQVIQVTSYVLYADRGRNYVVTDSTFLSQEN